MDQMWVDLLTAIAVHGKAMGVLMAAFGLSVSAGMALGQYVALLPIKRSLVSVAEGFKDSSILLRQVIDRLESQQRIHEQFSVRQESIAHDLAIVSGQLHAATRAMMDADRARSEELTSMIRHLFSALAKKGGVE